MNVLRANTWAAAAVIAACTLAPTMAFAQQDAWYVESTKAFEALKQKAGGGTKMTWDKLPDWTGIWLRQGGTAFDPKIRNYTPTSAKLTPEYQKKFEQRLQEQKEGREWDYLSYCLPPNVPRWLTEPFLHEFVLRPEQTWLINEMVSDVRRVYTNGEKHTPEDEAYPLFNGDSVGFWDNDTLVVHTTELKEGFYNRGQPDFSEQVSLIEKWRKIDADTMEVDATVWDPPALVEPWHVVFQYKKDKTPGLRIRLWACTENNNVVRDPSTGATDFKLTGEEGYKDPGKLVEGPAKQ